MRVRATGSPRAHPLEVVGHGRRSPRIPKPVDGRPTWQVARCQACNTQSDEAQATAIQHERSSLRCRRAVLLELDSCSVVSGDADGAGVQVASQAGSGRRCAKDRARSIFFFFINTITGPKTHRSGCCGSNPSRLATPALTGCGEKLWRLGRSHIEISHRGEAPKVNLE